MKESIKSIIEWQEKTFPDATLEGQIKKFNEEYGEYHIACPDMRELADMYIVACGIARFDSVVALEFFSVVFQILHSWNTVGAVYVFKEIIDEKMEKNRKRIWKKTGDGIYHHKNGIED